MVNTHHILNLLVCWKCVCPFQGSPPLVGHHICSEFSKNLNFSEHSFLLCCKSCCRSMWRSWRVVSGGEHIVMPKAWAHYKCLTMYHTAKVCLIMVCNCAWEEYKRLAVFCVFPRNYELYLYEPSSKLVLLFRVCLQFFPCYQVKYLGKFP